MRQLLALPNFGLAHTEISESLNLKFVSGEWGDSEHACPPSTSLLNWLVSNPSKRRHAPSNSARRDALLKGDPQVLRNALAAIEKNATGSAWDLLEGAIFPDATIVTPNAIVVIEGKRTEECSDSS